METNFAIFLVMKVGSELIVWERVESKRGLAAVDKKCSMYKAGVLCL